MRKTVHSKLICSYIFIGIVGFLFATAGGSHFVETYLEEEVGARLYDSAVRFASDAVTVQQIADNDSKGLEKIMDILASGEEAGILILDKNFHVIVQSSNLEYNVSSAKSTADSEVQTSETDKIPENGTSSEKFSAANTISIPYSDLDFWLNTQYQISNFYGYFSSPHLNVMISVENSGVTEGYVTYHYDMQQLYQKRSGLLGILQMVFFAVYALCGLLLLCYQKWIHTPMQQIIKGASEYANGDLSYRIPVKSEDEMGYLAKTLNYMADKINQNGEYQRTFIANVSHDLRTPLTAINGYLDLLEGEEKSTAAARYLALIENRTDAMTRLTEELFRYSVILAEEEPLAREPVVLNDALAESLASFYGALTSRGITPQIKICDARVTRLLDKDALARVLANILNNALKYSDGDLAVQLDEDGTLHFSNHAAALDEVSTAQLFDRFFTVENARHSTGLGLSIAKSLTEQMHGEISAAYSDSLLTITLRFSS